MKTKLTRIKDGEYELEMSEEFQENLFCIGMGFMIVSLIGLGNMILKMYI